MAKQKIIVICGPTASGKSTVAMRMAKEFLAEIVNADSMQIYRHMNIGTAKPTKGDRLKVAHYLIDHAEPDELFSAARYREDASQVIEQLGHKGTNIIVCGGTGLYLRVLTKGIFSGPDRDAEYRKKLETEAFEKGTDVLHERLRAVDPVSAKNIHPNNLVRIIRALEVFYASGRPFSDFHAEHAFTESPYDTLMLYMDLPRATLYERINARAEQMIENGLIEEVKTLLSLGYNEDLKPMRALGYKEMIEFIHERLTLSEATELLKKNTRNYAKKQITWFRNVEDLKRVSPDNIKEIKELIKGTPYVKKKILPKLSLLACTVIVLLITVLSSGYAVAKEEPSIKKVRGEGVSFELNDEREVRATAIDDALKKAVVAAYDSLIDQTDDTFEAKRLKESILSVPLNYILDYRVLSEGWIRHLVIEPGLPVPQDEALSSFTSAQMDDSDKAANDLINSPKDAPYGEDLPNDIASAQEQGLKLYHVWIEASVDFKELKNDLSLTPSFEGESTSLVTILLITITDYKDFASLKEAIEDLENVKEVTLDSFLKGKIVLTAEVWGNPHELLEKLKANKNLHDLDIIPSGIDRITIKGIVKR